MRRGAGRAIMKRLNRAIRLDKTYVRFICSFLLMLCLPVIGFVFLFMQNYREVYRTKIIEQAKNSLTAAGTDLERDIVSLHQIVSYNVLNADMSKASVRKDYGGNRVRGILNAEFITHSILKDIGYYNEVLPDTVHTKAGTYEVSYYARLHGGMADGGELLARLQDIEWTEWMLWQQDPQADGEPVEESLQYVVRTNRGEWWIFSIDEAVLGEILSAGDSATVLTDFEGRLLYASRPRQEGKAYELVYDSPNGYFRLVRYMDDKSLFAELNIWQRNFFLVVVLMLLAGGAMVLLLTYYNEHPFRELLAYCGEMIQNIPVGLGLPEAFRFTLNAMEKKVALSEDRQRRNRLLQHLIYGKDCDTEYFREAMREEGLFGRAESYRVVLVASAGRSEADMGQIESFLEERQDREYEIQLLDIPNRNAAAMIVGMTEAKKAGLEEELLRIAGCVDERSRFFVGGEAAGLSKINLSYNQALSLGRSGGKEGQGRILYYQPGPASAEDGKKGKGDADMKSGEAGEEQTDKEDFIRSVTDFIDRNSRSPELSASMVSDFFGISISRMSHRFKAQTGRTISDYITEKKFLYVCELLTETEESVKDIAFLVGYSHSVSFIRKFRQLHGMTPVEYRERKRAAENVENKENQE